MLKCLVISVTHSNWYQSGKPDLSINSNWLRSYKAMKSVKINSSTLSNIKQDTHWRVQQDETQKAKEGWEAPYART